MNNSSIALTGPEFCHILKLTEAPAPLNDVSQGALFFILGDTNEFKETDNLQSASNSASES